MRVTCFKTAMIGGGLSFDCYVPVSDVPAHVLTAHPGGSYYTRILRDGEEYLSFLDATLSPEHIAMPQGWERYQDVLAHDKAIRREALALCCSVFPELLHYTGDGLPSLWLMGLPLPAEVSAAVTINR